MSRYAFVMRRPDGTTEKQSPDRPIDGRVVQSWLNGWTYCKASKREVAATRLLPVLTALTAVLSAATGTAVFVTLSQQTSTWARVVVGSVAIFTAAVTAVQSWVSTRLKGLNDQAQRFHDFHRQVEKELADFKDVTDADYADDTEKKLDDLTAGITEPYVRHWQSARTEVIDQLPRMCPELAARLHLPTEPWSSTAGS